MKRKIMTEISKQDRNDKEKLLLAIRALIEKNV